MTGAYYFLLLTLVVLGVLAYGMWSALLTGSELWIPGVGSAVDEGIAGAVWLFVLWTIAAKGRSPCFWPKLPTTVYVFWWFLLTLYLLPMLFIVSARRPGAGVLFVLLSVVLFVPLNRSNWSYASYWTGLMWRSVYTLQWARYWAAAVVRAEWNFAAPDTWWMLFVVLGVLALNLLMVYLLEYRVDWAALQREVEARTGASSASA